MARRAGRIGDGIVTRLIFDFILFVVTLLLVLYAPWLSGTVFGLGGW